MRALLCKSTSKPTCTSSFKSKSFRAIGGTLLIGSLASSPSHAGLFDWLYGNNASGGQQSLSVSTDYFALFNWWLSRFGQGLSNDNTSSGDTTDNTDDTATNDDSGDTVADSGSSLDSGNSGTDDSSLSDGSGDDSLADNSDTDTGEDSSLDSSNPETTVTDGNGDSLADSGDGSLDSGSDDSLDSGGDGSLDPAPSEPAVFSITLRWDAPTQRVDGAVLAIADIAGYEVYYTDELGGSDVVYTIDSSTQTNLVLEDLPAGTHYFTIATVDSEGQKSPMSEMLEVPLVELE